MARHYTRRERDGGELAARRLSKKGYALYSGSDVAIFERRADDGGDGWLTVYDVSGIWGDYSGLTFKELVALFDEWADMSGQD